MISCTEIIREDENFYTIKFKCTGSLVHVLKSIGIKEVYKGDQNLLWDALLTDLVLYKTLKNKISFVPFLHDEKLGTGDYRLIPFYKDNGRYTLTEDYAQKFTGAVYINQDISYGLFYGVPIEPNEYKELNFKLSWLADYWKDYKSLLEKDEDFLKVLEVLGFTWNYEKHSMVTYTGAVANIQTLRNYFEKNPKAEIYYLFSKSLGWYGVVPRYPEEISLSSIYIDEELKNYIKKLFILGVRGVLKQVKTNRREILKRAKKIHDYAKKILESDKDITISDFQLKLANQIISEIIGDVEDLNIRKTSDILKISCIEDLDNKDFYYFFDLVLRFTETFAEAYNNALNKARLPLKRMLLKNGIYRPPYFLEIFINRDGKRILTRCNIEIKDDEKFSIKLFSPHCSSLVLLEDKRINNAKEFLNVLLNSENFPNGFALIGKAGPFMAEMRRFPRVLAVPEEGSKYAPMVDYFLGELRKSIRNLPESHLIRIRINLLDNLKFLEGFVFKLPKFLSLYIGKNEISAHEFSEIWRSKVEEVEKVLKFINGLELGEYFHLANIILWEKGFIVDLERSQKLLNKLITKGYKSEFKKFPFPKEFLDYLKELSMKRREVIKNINEKKAEAPSYLYEERRILEYKILFIFGVFIRSLLLFEKSLKYLNYRPYSIVLYLISPEFVRQLIENAEVYIEKVVFKL